MSTGELDEASRAQQATSWQFVTHGGAAGTSLLLDLTDAVDGLSWSCFTHDPAFLTAGDAALLHSRQIEEVPA